MHPAPPGEPPRLSPSFNDLEALRQRLQAVQRKRRPRLRWQWPLVLFLATCASTFFVHAQLSWVNGLMYASTVMVILTAHEFGHYLQARRYRVPASLPYFLPMPFSIFGTLGAVIVMRPHRANPKALFDIAASGPLAGLLPALLACIFGLQWSELVDAESAVAGMRLGEPLIFKFLTYLLFDPLAEGKEILLHPVAFAGWVGLFITALNLLPIGQLDGGHILYTLLGKKAHLVSVALHSCAVLVVLVDVAREVFWQAGAGYWPWGLLVILLFFLGVKHPPTADDSVTLDRGRTLLGWALLFFVIVGFTPRPLIL